MATPCETPVPGVAPVCHGTISLPWKHNDAVQSVRAAILWLAQKEHDVVSWTITVDNEPGMQREIKLTPMSQHPAMYRINPSTAWTTRNGDCTSDLPDDWNPMGEESRMKQIGPVKMMQEQRRGAYLNRVPHLIVWREVSPTEPFLGWESVLTGGKFPCRIHPIVSLNQSIVGTAGPTHRRRVPYPGSLTLLRCKPPCHPDSSWIRPEGPSLSSTFRVFDQLQIVCVSTTY